jgi:chemotaxis protein MotB
MNRNKIFLFMTGAMVLFQACVPAQKLNDANARIAWLESQQKNWKADSTNLQNQLLGYRQSLADVTSQLSTLRNDTAYFAEKYRKAEKLNEHLNELYEKVIEQNRQLISHSASDKISLNDSLRSMMNSLTVQRKKLDSLQLALLFKEQKLNELQQLIRMKDSVSQALKEKISTALLGFEKSDLTVENRNGRVYVSMADKLLFKTGSTAVDAKGVEAIQKLSQVLKANSDMNITVEGHTDNVPLSGKGIMRDNWDLSVLRATSIIRILEQNGVSPLRITASGHGEFQPVMSNESIEGRAKNRRTEIIISPRLSEVYQLLQDF